jgi:hypothetical protein
MRLIGYQIIPNRYLGYQHPKAAEHMVDESEREQQFENLEHVLLDVIDTHQRLELLLESVPLP